MVLGAQNKPQVGKKTIATSSANLLTKVATNIFPSELNIAAIKITNTKMITLENCVLVYVDTYI